MAEIRQKNPQKIKKTKKKVKYSLLTFVLLICIIELAVSAFNNINKTFSFSKKIKGLEQKRNEELERNRELKSKIENYNSESTLESIGRNNLKMAGENEILVIINKPKDDNLTEVQVTNKKR